MITNPVGSVLSGVLAEYLGRRRAIQISSLPFMIGFLCIAMSRDIWALYVGRLISGIAAGLLKKKFSINSYCSPFFNNLQEKIFNVIVSNLNIQSKKIFSRKFASIILFCQKTT